MVFRTIKKIKIILDYESSASFFKIVTDTPASVNLAGYATLTYWNSSGSVNTQSYQADGSSDDTFTMPGTGGGIIELSGLDANTWFIEADIRLSSSVSFSTPFTST